MKRDEADRLARILLALRQDGLPVARWLPVGESWCIALAPGRCVVMEEALPGRSIAREDLTDAQLAETARTLARFHASVAEIARPLGPFRPDFAARLDTFGQLVVELWRLLAYARHHLRYESKGNPDLRSILGWLDGRGEAIWQRFERVSKELEAALKTVDDQPVLGDFNATNVLFEGGQLSGVVDYEDVHHGPRELDVLGYCLFGLSEPHLPDRLDEFVDAYLGENPGGLQVRALGPIARAICNAQLWRRLQRELSASLLSPGPLQTDVPGMLDRLDKLCLDLEHFD
jgi:Ser/Thr protein kinase RdoA (MazF antagonist)